MSDKDMSQFAEDLGGAGSGFKGHAGRDSQNLRGGSLPRGEVSNTVGASIGNPIPKKIAVPDEDDVRDALKLIIKNREAPALNYAINYASAGMGMSGEELKVQILYVLNNIGGWRGEEATRARNILKAYSKNKPFEFSEGDDMEDSYSIKPEGEKFCVYKGDKKIGTFDSKEEAQAKIDGMKGEMDDGEDEAVETSSNFIFTELDDAMAGDEVSTMDGLAAGTFTSNSGRQVTFDETEMPDYAANTNAIISSTKTEKGEVVGLPIDMDAHDHKGGAGWIVGAEYDKARKVVRFLVKWTKEGQKIIKDNTRRFFSPSTDITNKAVLGGSLTNWPASRSSSGHMMLRPVELSQQLKEIDLETLIEKLVELPMTLSKSKVENLSQGDTNMGNETVNPTLTEILKSPAAVQELGRQANEKAQELVMADRRKREVVEFASTLVGGTKERPFGLPIAADDVVAILLSLPMAQSKAVEKLLTMTLNSAIDFAEHGYSYAVEGSLLNSGKPRMARELTGYLSEWLKVKGNDIAGFFSANPELGDMKDYNLAEFTEKAKV